MYPQYPLADDPRRLVPLDDLDPVTAVPLPDAGLTAYRAIKRSLPRQVPASTVVAIGTGGLGHAAIQLLRALTPAWVIALDVGGDKPRLAKEVGAHETVLLQHRHGATVRALTGGLGAEAVFDFVGSEPTVRTAAAVAAVEDDVAIVGIGGASLPVGFGTLPFECPSPRPTGAAAAS